MISAEVDIVGISTRAVLIAHFTFPALGLQVDGLNVSSSVGFLVGRGTADETTPITI